MNSLDYRKISEDGIIEFADLLKRKSEALTSDLNEEKVSEIKITITLSRNTCPTLSITKDYCS